MSTYTYLLTDTLNDLVDIGSLQSEIQDSSITIAIDSITEDGTNINVNFKAAISTSEETTLDGLVAAHTGESIETPTDSVSVSELSNTGSVSGLPKVIVENDEGDFYTQISNNLCVDGSEWTMEPNPNTVLYVEKSEIQFNHDLSMGNEKVVLTYYVWHPSSPGVPIPGQTVEFPTLYSMFEYGNTHSHCPAIGTELPNGLSTIHFNYVKKLVFHANETPGKLAKLSVKTESGNALSGSYCVATFVTDEETV